MKHCGAPPPRTRLLLPTSVPRVECIHDGEGERRARRLGRRVRHCDRAVLGNVEETARKNTQREQTSENIRTQHAVDSPAMKRS